MKLKRRKPSPRQRLLAARNHAENTYELLHGLILENEAEEKLAECVKTLRGIVNRDEPWGNWAKGMARATLKRIGADT